MKVDVCTWKSCWWKFSKYILTRLTNDIKFCNWKNIELQETLCMWQCKKWVNIKIDNQIHNYIQPAKASDLVSQRVKSLKKEEAPKSKKSKHKK